MDVQIQILPQLDLTSPGMKASLGMLPESSQIVSFHSLQRKLLNSPLGHPLLMKLLGLRPMTNAAEFFSIYNTRHANSHSFDKKKSKALAKQIESFSSVDHFEDCLGVNSPVYTHI